MVRLKSRERPVPSGGPFTCHATGYMAPRNANFWPIVDGCIAARLANPGRTRAANASVDRSAVADEVDSQWAMYCHQHKYFDYIVGEPEGVQGRPFQQPPAPRLPGEARPSLGQSAGRVAAGSQIIVDWLASGAEAVPMELAHKRAAICAVCPLNEKGDWTSFFTNPVSEAIRKSLNLRRDWNLSTPDDDKLGVCSACSCPLKLKCHLPLDRILSKIPQESKDALAEGCWIKSEEKPA